MKMQDFMTAYVQSIMNALQDKSISIHSLDLECKHCPLRGLCHADDAEDMSCADFIAKHISDSQSYRVH